MGEGKGSTRVVPTRILPRSQRSRLCLSNTWACSRYVGARAPMLSLEVVRDEIRLHHKRVVRAEHRHDEVESPAVVL